METPKDLSKNIAVNLNLATDLLAKQVRTIELVLEQVAGIATGCYVPFRVHELPNGDVRQSVVGYEKLDGKYQIVVSVYDPVMREQRPYIRWGDCSRGIKVRSGIALDALFDALVKDATQVHSFCNAALERTSKIAHIAAEMFDAATEKNE